MMLPRVQQVMRQARARVLGGDTGVDGKLVRLFDGITEIIRNGKASKPTEFGKLVKIQERQRQIIVDYEIYGTCGKLVDAPSGAQADFGSPESDSAKQLAEKILKRQRHSRGRAEPGDGPVRGPQGLDGAAAGSPI
jgi:hypothetical protein